MKSFIVLSALLVAATASLAVPPPPPIIVPSTQTAVVPPPPILVATKKAATAAVPAPPIIVPNKEPDPIRIAMVQTLFIDVPTPLVNMLSPAFRGMMKEYTGLHGQIAAGGDAFDIAKDLMDDKSHVAVLNGVEYAWVSQKYPEIKPLMLAVSKYHSLKAHLVVAGEGSINDFSELKGKELAMTFRPREHLRLFVEKNCQTVAKSNPKAFFSKMVKPMHSEAALDDVLAGKTDAAVVDTLAWENYGEVHPGRTKRLKVIAESDPFPTAVVVYRQGFLSDATLEKFRKGMVSANKSERGRDLMMLWKLTGFEPVPAEYAECCANIMRAYPAPVPATVVSRPGER